MHNNHPATRCLNMVKIVFPLAGQTFIPQHTRQPQYHSALWWRVQLTAPLQLFEESHTVQYPLLGSPSLGFRCPIERKDLKLLASMQCSKTKTVAVDQWHDKKLNCTLYELSLGGLYIGGTDLQCRAWKRPFGAALRSHIVKKHSHLSCCNVCGFKCTY
jgi:hypothetical protein